MGLSEVIIKVVLRRSLLRALMATTVTLLAN